MDGSSGAETGTHCEMLMRHCFLNENCLSINRALNKLTVSQNSPTRKIGLEVVKIRYVGLHKIG